MIQHVVTEIGGIAGFGVISICLFVAVFSGALLWAFCQKKSFMKSMSSLPLQDEEAGMAGKGEQQHD
jgi:hypothetical protein